MSLRGWLPLPAVEHSGCGLLARRCLLRSRLPEGGVPVAVSKAGNGFGLLRLSRAVRPRASLVALLACSYAWGSAGKLGENKHTCEGARRWRLSRSKGQTCHVSPVRRNLTQRAAAGSEKPARTTLYTKAGPDGVSLGDCPFSHAVQIALRLKGIDFDVVPCTQETKPQWLLDEVGGKMPCVCHDGVPHVESKEILAWIDTEFPEPPLALPASASAALQEDFGLFPAIAAYTKSTDSAEDDMLKVNVQMKLASLRAHLSGVLRGDFVCGQNPTLADCRIFPALYILNHATSHYKGFGLEAFPEGDDVREYFARCMAFEPVKASCYPGEVCVWGWGQARGEK